MTATGRVQEAGGVGRKASLSNSRIPNASGVADEGISTYRRVTVAIIVQERLNTDGRVEAATGVQPERIKAQSRIELASGKA